jgi:transcriptional regulator with XRE-family HTH domain
MDFSDKFYKLRTQAGYSQEAISEKIGVSRQSVSKWELGSAIPDSDKLVLISKIFNVSIDYLLMDNHDEEDNSMDLDHLVVRFIASAKEVNVISDQLVEIAKDGIIDEDEKKKLKEITDTLNSVSMIINELKCKIGDNPDSLQ